MRAPRSSSAALIAARSFRLTSAVAAVVGLADDSVGLLGAVMAASKVAVSSASSQKGAS